MDRRRLDRRSFLREGCAAAAGMAAFTGALAGQEGPAPQPGVEEKRPAPPALPPPFASGTWAKRQGEARALLKEAGAAGLLEVPGGSLTYLTGLALAPTERLVVLLLPVEGPSLLLARAVEKEAVQALAGTVDEVILLEEDEAPIHLLEKAIRKRDLSDARLALASSFRYDDLATLHRTFTRANFISSGPILTRLRQAKAGDEMIAIQAAAAIAVRAIERVTAEVRAGAAEDELALRIESAMREAGAEGQARVLSGPRTSVPLARSSARRLQSGDVVLMDACARVHGYHGAVTRTAILGRPTGRMKLIQETIRRAQEFVLERGKAGVRCAVLDQAARSTLGGRGFAAEVRHGVGEGLGLEASEEPWLSIASTDPIPAGAIATVGPATYTPGEYGIRARDVMEVTPTGGRWLTTPPGTILEIG